MAFDYSNSFAGINNAINSFGKTLEERRQRQTLASLGKQAIDGDYNAAAAAAFASGDAGTGLGLLKLGQTQKEQAAGRQLLQSWGIGGSSLPAPNTTSPAPAAPVSGTSDLIQNESGGNWAAQNNAVGAGGARGHFGRAQFGQARLQEAAAAGAIPQGTTPQQFMQSPELQKRAEAWHFGDIDNKIAANGFDRLVGQTINGVPITIAGLRNVAHLGGTQGMKRFIETGGRYNPSDANGTSLMDYLQMGARSSNGVRTASADAPAPGAAYASQNTGATGFAVPPGAQPAPAISIDPNSNDAGSRTFLQSQVMSPLAALGMAPAPQAAPQTAPQTAPMPPRRPADLAPSQPAEAAPAATAAPAQPVSGDDPAKLRADADYYERTNPEAARQLRARADAMEAAASRGSQAAPAQIGMNGRTFDAISAGQPLDPAFKSEGVSQPWMGSALAPQREASPQVAATLDPRADQTPGTGRPTQGFAVPQGQASSPSVTDDKDVRLWQDRYSAAAATNNERAMAIAKQRLEMAVKAAERRMDVEKPTDVQRNYAAAVKQGYQGTLFDYQQALRSKTEVNIDQKGQTKFEEEFGKAQAKRWNDYIAEGDVAQGRLADIQTLREASRRLGSQGSSANLKATIGPYAESLGINVDGLPDIQLYESITQRLAPTLRAPGSGSTSDIEFKGFQRAIGPLSNNPAAREMILDTFEAASRNDLARANIGSRLATGEIDRGQAERELRALPNPMEAFREFRKQNPDLVGQAIKESGARNAAEKRDPVRVTSPDEARKLPSGTRIILPDGRQGQVP